MNELSYMDKLLDGVEVEWKELGEVCRFINGRAYKRPELLDQGKYPVLRVGNFFTNGNWYHSNLELDEDKYCDNGDLLYAWSASFGPRIWEGGKVIYHYHIWKVIPETEVISKKYLFYLLDWDTEALKAEHGTGSTMMHVGKGSIEKRMVPVPSLNVQAEIVRILDAFTELTAELTAELVARKQQYAYYQEELLTFEDNVEREELKEIAIFSQGIQVDTLKQFSEKPDSFVRFLRIVDFVKDNEPPRYIENPGDRYVKNEGDLVMIRYGARAAGKVFLKYGGAIANNMFQIKLTTPKITIAYLHCYLSQQKIYNFLNSNGGNSTMPAITFSQIGSVKIPIPPLAEQERIVTILDKFDTLTTSLTEGLPREIALRQQQYEYYRELLLSFPKLKGEA